MEKSTSFNLVFLPYSKINPGHFWISRSTYPRRSKNLRAARESDRSFVLTYSY